VSIPNVAYVTDVHLDEATPRSRKDDFQEAIFAKLEESMQLALEHKAYLFCIGGDLFNKPDPYRVSHRLVLRTVALFQKYKDLGLEIIIDPGNHDMSPAGVSTVMEKQPLGVLAAAGVAKILFSKDYVDRASSDRESSVVISAAPFGRQTDTPEGRSVYGLPEEIKAKFPDAVHVRMTHGVVLPPGQRFFGDFTTYDQFASDAADVTLCGHMHMDFDILQVQGKWFVQPGALARGALDEYNLDREVKVVIIGEDGDRICFKKIPLKSAKPAEEIFKVEEVKRSKARSAQMEEFVSMIKDEISSSGMLSFQDSIRAFCDKNKISREVQDSALEYVTTAEAVDQR